MQLAVSNSQLRPGLVVRLSQEPLAPSIPPLVAPSQTGLPPEPLSLEDVQQEADHDEAEADRAREGLVGVWDAWEGRVRECSAGGSVCSKGVFF